MWFQESEINPNDYIDIIGAHVLPILKRGNPALLFMHEWQRNATKLFLTANGIPTLEWPSQLTDLSTIEYIISFKEEKACSWKDIAKIVDAVATVKRRYYRELKKNSSLLI